MSLRLPVSSHSLAAVIAAALGIAATGCSSSFQQAPLIQPDQFRVSEMKRDEYQILGDASARACRNVVALWPIPIWFQVKPSFSFFSWVWNAENDAWQQALASQPSADAVLLPRTTKDETYAFWFHKVCYDVRAKAVRLKPDGERAAPTAVAATSPSVSAPPAPPPPPAPPAPPAAPTAQ